MNSCTCKTVSSHYKMYPSAKISEDSR